MGLYPIVVLGSAANAVGKPSLVRIQVQTQFCTQNLLQHWHHIMHTPNHIHAQAK